MIYQTNLPITQPYRHTTVIIKGPPSAMDVELLYLGYI